MDNARASSEDTSASAPRRRLGVVVVDALPVVRAGLARLVQEREDMELLGDAGESDPALELLAAVPRSRVTVLVGLGLSGDTDAFGLIRAIRERHPAHAIVAVGANADVGTVSRALFMGADGFVDKGDEPAEFLDAIKRAADGEMVLSGPASGAVGEIAATIERRAELDTVLTQREREVLSIAAEGLTAKQIAARLGVRERTVTTHLARIYGKLGVGSRLAAIRVAARSGYAPVIASE
jgi:two-component system nitrate/nitrite response regulator NarL